MYFSNSQKELTEYLQKNGILKTPRIIYAFSQIDRKDFVGKQNYKNPYADNPLYIWYEATISQPTVVGLMLEWLQPKPEEKILEIWSGSWRVSCIMAKIVGKKWYIYWLEIVPELVEIAKQNSIWYNLKNLEFKKAYENKIWLKEKSPFQKILVSASWKKFPNSLLDQLGNSGKIVIPIQNDIRIVTKKSKKKTDIQKFWGFSFIPLK